MHAYTHIHTHLIVDYVLEVGAALCKAKEEFLVVLPCPRELVHATLLRRALVGIVRHDAHCRAAVDRNKNIIRLIDALKHEESMQRHWSQIEGEKERAKREEARERKRGQGTEPE